MMRNTLAAGIVFASTSAHAQTGFEIAEISLGNGMPISEGIVDYNGVDIRAAYNIGNLGFQIDGSYFHIADYIYSSESYGASLHLNKTLGNDYTVGFYAGYSATNIINFDFNYYSFGVEGMKHFGDFRVQAALGTTYVTFSPGSPAFYNAVLGVDYRVSPRFVIGLDYKIHMSPYAEPMHDREIYATYDINNAVSLSAYYETPISGANNGLAGFVATVRIGRGDRDNLFSSRQFDLLSILYR